MGFVSAAIGVISLIGASKAKSSARKAAAEEARLEGIVTGAKIETLQQEETVLRGQTIAGAAGSGVNVTKGSPLQILAEQAKTFAREKKTVATAGASRAAQAKTRGRMVGQQAMYHGISSALGSFGQAASSTAKTGSFFSFG